MAVKPTIDLTSIISRAVSGLRLGERVGNVPSVKSKRTQELAGPGQGREARGEPVPVLRGRLQHAGVRER